MAALSTPTVHTAIHFIRFLIAIGYLFVNIFVSLRNALPLQHTTGRQIACRHIGGTMLCAVENGEDAMLRIALWLTVIV